VFGIQTRFAKSNYVIAASSDNSCPIRPKQGKFRKEFYSIDINVASLTFPRTSGIALEEIFLALVIIKCLQSLQSNFSKPGYPTMTRFIGSFNFAHPWPGTVAESLKCGRWFGYWHRGNSLRPLKREDRHEWSYENPTGAIWTTIILSEKGFRGTNGQLTKRRICWICSRKRHCNRKTEKAHWQTTQFKSHETIGQGMNLYP